MLQILFVLSFKVSLVSLESLSDHAKFTTKEYYVQVDSDDKVSRLALISSRYGLKYVKQVSPHVHVFSDEIQQEQRGSHHISQITNFSAFFHEEIKEIQEVTKNPVRTFLPPTRLTEVSNMKRYKRTASVSMTCDPYYGMDIEEAWALNYTGNGINIGILDVGVDTHHPDLHQNINAKLGYNFADPYRRSDFQPNYESQNYPEADDLADHGTNIAGLIASIKGNEMCSAGVAFNAKIVPLVVFKLEASYWYWFQFDDTFIPDALVHKNQEIHVYSSSFNYRDPFNKPSLPLRDSLQTGVNEGRNGKGSVFVFSVGDNSKGIWDGNTDYFANSIHTITIGSVGINGTVPYYSIPCACIIASALSDGNTLDSDSLQTTSQRNSCRHDFKGNSSATGIAAAIIGLGLSDRLSWRDVQYILVSTSSMEGLKQTLHSAVNAKGFNYNPHFGFGLMNATSFSIVSKLWKPVPHQLSSVFYTTKRTRLTSRPRSKEPDAYMVNVFVDDCTNCVRYIEHIVAEITYTATREKLVSFSLYSPSKTKSVILHSAQESWPRLQKQEKKKFRRTWKFSSVQFWGESPNGDWILIMTQYDKKKNRSYKFFTVHNFTLFIYGTSTDPFKENAEHIRQTGTEDNRHQDNFGSFLNILETQDELNRVFYEVIEGDAEAILEESVDSRKNYLVTYMLAIVILVSPFPFIIACCMNYAISQRNR